MQRCETEEEAMHEGKNRSQKSLRANGEAFRSKESGTLCVAGPLDEGRAHTQGHGGVVVILWLGLSIRVMLPLTSSGRQLPLVSPWA